MHKVIMLSDQHFLSHATALATSQLFPALFLFLSIVLFQVVFDLCLTLWLSVVHPTAEKQLSFTCFLLSMCTNQFHLCHNLQLISLISAISYIQSFVCHSSPCCTSSSLTYTASPVCSVTHSIPLHSTWPHPSLALQFHIPSFPWLLTLPVLPPSWSPCSTN